MRIINKKEEKIISCLKLEIFMKLQLLSRKSRKML